MLIRLLAGVANFEGQNDKRLKDKTLFDDRLSYTKKINRIRDKFVDQIEDIQFTEIPKRVHKAKNFMQYLQEALYSAGYQNDEGVVSSDYLHDTLYVPILQQEAKYVKLTRFAGIVCDSLRSDSSIFTPIMANILAENCHKVYSNILTREFLCPKRILESAFISGWSNVNDPQLYDMLLAKSCYKTAKKSKDSIIIESYKNVQRERVSKVVRKYGKRKKAELLRDVALLENGTYYQEIDKEYFLQKRAMCWFFLRQLGIQVKLADIKLYFYIEHD